MADLVWVLTCPFLLLCHYKQLIHKVRFPVCEVGGTTYFRGPV